MPPTNFNPEQFITALKNSYGSGISTDVVGVFGDWYDAREFWQYIFKEVGEGREKSQMPGIEVLLWRFVAPWDELGSSDAVPVAGFHGRTGIDPDLSWFNPIRLLTIGFTILLQSTPKALQRLSLAQDSKPHYFLIHETEARSVFQNNQLPTALPCPLAIENNPFEESYEVTREAVETLTKAGIPCVPVFDIVHYLLEKPNSLINPSKHWHEMLQKLDALGPCIVHISLGTNSHDSLPVEMITEDMWSELASVLNSKLRYVVIEYQRSSFLDKLWSVPLEDEEFAQRTVSIFKLLTKHKII